jgi:hypothetical protein
MPQFHEYSADFCDIVYGGIHITGFADNAFVEIEFEEDDFKKQTGSLGDVTRTRQLNRSGKITITLMDAAPVNDQLMQFAATDRATGGGFKPFTFQDRSSNTTARATEVWVMKLPKVGRAKESGTTVWVFEAAFLDVTIGGSVL